MTTNTPVIAILNNGRAIFGQYIRTQKNGFLAVQWIDRGEGYRHAFVSESVFPQSHDGLNLAFERSAQLRLKEALENGEIDLLPTEVSYIAQAVKNKEE